jgi:hypothetical protein
MEKTKIIKFNCGGELFSVSSETISKYNDCLLYKMISGHFIESQQEEIFIDKDPRVFRAIINLMRNDELFIPPGVSKKEMIFELDYYNLLCKTNIIPKGDFWCNNDIFKLSRNVCDSFLNSNDFLKQMKTKNFIWWEIYSFPEKYKGICSQFNCFISSCLDIMIKYMKEIHKIKIKDNTSVCYGLPKEYITGERRPLNFIFIYHNNEKIKFETSNFSKEEKNGLIHKQIQLSPIY